MTVFYCRGALELLRQIADKRRRSRGGAVKLTAREQLAEKLESVVFAPLEGKAAGRVGSPRGSRRRASPLAPDARELLAFLAGSDLTRMDGRAGQAVRLRRASAPQITEADVRAIVPPSLEYSIFQLLDKLLDRRSARGARRCARRCSSSGMNAARMLGTLTSLLRQLAHMRRGLDAGQNAAALQRDARHALHPTRRSRRQSSAESAPAEELQGVLLPLSVEVEFAVKSGRLRDSRRRSTRFFCKLPRQISPRNATNARIFSSKESEFP